MMHEDPKDSCGKCLAMLVKFAKRNKNQAAGKLIHIVGVVHDFEMTVGDFNLEMFRFED